MESHRVAACKVVAITSETTPQDRKSLDKEMRVHSAMKHQYVLEFYSAFIVEDEPKTKYFPGVYMLLELASGGDLFDKIGEYTDLRIAVLVADGGSCISAGGWSRRRNCTILFQSAGVRTSASVHPSSVLPSSNNT